jgi:hypothetical protein
MDPSILGPVMSALFPQRTNLTEVEELIDYFLTNFGNAAEFRSIRNRSAYGLRTMISHIAYGLIFLRVEGTLTDPYLDVQRCLYTAAHRYLDEIAMGGSPRDVSVFFRLRRYFDLLLKAGMIPPNLNEEAIHDAIEGGLLDSLDLLAPCFDIQHRTSGRLIWTKLAESLEADGERIVASIRGEVNGLFDT